jgi:hypothetical protein
VHHSPGVDHERASAPIASLVFAGQSHFAHETVVTIRDAREVLA